MSDEEHLESGESPYTSLPLVASNNQEYESINPLKSTSGRDPSTITQVPKSELFGYLLVGLSAVAFASNVICVRIAETRYSMHPFQVVYILSVVVTILALAYLSIFTPFPSLLSSLSRHQWRIIIIRGIAGGLTCIFLYSAVDYIPSGDADAIYFMSPALVIFLSHIFLKEYATLPDIVLAILSISGAILVSISTSESHIPYDRLKGSLYAVIGAFLNAVGLVLVRSIVSYTHFMLLVLSLGACSIPITVALGGFVSRDQVANEWRGPAAAFACAIFGFVAQTLMHWGLKYTRAGTGSLVRNLEVPSVYILAILILHETPTLLKVFGSMLVVGAAVAIGIRQLFRSAS